MGESFALNLFDRFHLGHETLIDKLSDMPGPVAVVTGGEIVGKGLDLETIIQPIDLRVAKLKEYLASEGLSDSIGVMSASRTDDLVAIQNKVTFLMYQGPCCDEIKSGALTRREQELGHDDDLTYMKPVRAFDGNKLTSARIRKGEIDRQGKRLRGTKEPPRRLDLSLRTDLKAPKGDVYDRKEGLPEKRVVTRIRSETPKLVIAVGDVTSATLIDEGYTPDVSIVDGITKRGKYEERFSGEREYSFYNPAAVLYPEAWATIDTAIHDKQKSLVTVDGEEDLMGFPGVLLAPNGSVMLYGQPDVGIVWVPVDKANKSLARSLLDAMPIIQ
ncbi:MAG: DUF359 domain-containing protein [Candidatus Thorarchaeota archaeon]|jgi:uncharacterized protein (UPF0218 family)/phosphopantetheine adenylyltransferase